MGPQTPPRRIVNVLLSVSTASDRVRRTLREPQSLDQRASSATGAWDRKLVVDLYCVTLPVFPRGEHHGPNAIGVELDQAEGNYR